jgi:hypothetical protein
MVGDSCIEVLLCLGNRRCGAKAGRNSRSLPGRAFLVPFRGSNTMPVLFVSPGNS